MEGEDEQHLRASFPHLDYNHEAEIMLIRVIYTLLIIMRQSFLLPSDLKV
jgi:hypothetical protein